MKWSTASRRAWIETSWRLSSFHMDGTRPVKLGSLRNGALVICELGPKLGSRLNLHNRIITWILDDDNFLSVLTGSFFFF
jgi:hypothetical protein